MPFTIQLRADLVSPRMTEALRAAGCREVWIGAESGSQKILDAMNKGTSVGEIVRARDACWATPASASASSCSSAISAKSSTTSWPRAGWCEEARPDDVGVSVSYPLPGTKFYEVVKQQLGAKTPLAGEQRSRDDVRRHLHARSSTARCATCCTTQVTHAGRRRRCSERWDELVRQ